MSTRSTINIENDDGTVDGIYCHYDGFPDNNGKLLLQHYDDKEKIRDLINLGDISFLGPTLEQEDTKSYFRSKGDPKRIGHYKNAEVIPRQDYNYLWRDNLWWMSEWEGKWVPLDQIIMEEKKEKFYPRIDEKVEEEPLTETYDPAYLFIKAEDSLPTHIKKSFNDIVRDIQRTLFRENFSELQVEDYLKQLIEEIVQ